MLLGYYLGIDMGSSSIKASLLNDGAKIIKKVKIPVSIITTKEGYFEIDPVKTWWDGFKKVLQDLSLSISLKDISSICISSVCGCFVPVDKNFNPVYNAFLYGIDARSKAQVEYLNGKFGDEYLNEHFGGVFTTHSSIPKILWLKETYPYIYEQSAYFVESNSYITSILTGVARWDYPTAAGAKLLDLTCLNLPFGLLESIGIDYKKIPLFISPTDFLGKISKNISMELGLSENTKVYAGACDVNAEAMAIGSINIGDMMVVYGTTISSLFIIKDLVRLKGFMPSPSIIKDTYRLGAASSSGARFIDWADNLVRNKYELVAGASPTGILMLPYLDGARSPFDNPDAKPVIFGLKADSSLKDIYVAAREAIGYEVGLLIEMLNKISYVPDTINCMGGLTNVKELMQIVSDITGKKQKIYNNIDASYGDALIALLSQYKLSEIDNLDEVKANRKPNEIIIPNLEVSALYRQYTERYNQLYKRLEDLF